MGSRSSRVATTLFTIFFLISIPAHAQNLIAPSYVYKFNTETARLWDNALVSDGTFLYDVNYDGGPSGGGSIFRIKPDGSEFSILFSFENNSTGLNPVGTLVLDGSTLYGMTIFGGANNMGIIYKISTDGNAFQSLMDFNGTNGALPYCSLIISGSTLYGLSQQGGAAGTGHAFKLQTDGTGYQALADFAGESGYSPTGSLTISGDTLYGVTVRGGIHDLGVVFAFNTDGTNYRKLVEFEQATGSTPFGSLTLVGKTLYGTTDQGGPQYFGTLFKVHADGSDYKVIHYFAASGGINPWGKMLFDGENLYGMTVNGGSGNGLIYQIDTAGNNYTVLHNFNKADGRNPFSSLTKFDNKMYGHIAGGIHDYGVIFSLSMDGLEFDKLKDFEATNMGYEARGGLLLTPASGFGTTNKGGEYNQGVIYKVRHDGTFYEVIHNFDGEHGAAPESSMTLSGGFLYGTTTMGGISGTGTLFRIDTTGLTFEVLVDFTGDNGSYPVGALADDGQNSFYGMTGSNSTNGKGTVFKFDKVSGSLTTIFSFEGTNASYPYGQVIVANGKLYGTSLGGFSGGVVFSLNPDGSEFIKILDKNATQAGRYPNSLTASGNVLYGTMTQGGADDWGTLYRVDTDGSNFRKLVDFSYENGAIPTGAIIVLNDSTLFGMTRIGGPHDSGVAYSVRNDGSDYTILFNFDEVNIPVNGRRQSSATPLVASGSWTFANGVLYAPLSLQSGDLKTGGIITFSPDLTETVTAVELQPNPIALFPNPTAENITMSDGTNLSRAFVINSMGNKVNTMSSEGRSLNVSGLPSGVYYLVVGVNRYRFIKL